jgi:RNA recognition motif-containing protein
MARLYIGNLAHETTDADLMSKFSPFGAVKSIKVAADRRGRARGYAHVEMADDGAATAAIEALRGTQLNGRTMDIVLEEGKRGGRPRR